MYIHVSVLPTTTESKYSCYDSSGCDRTLQSTNFHTRNTRSWLEYNPTRVHVSTFIADIIKAHTCLVGTEKQAGLMKSRLYKTVAIDITMYMCWYPIL